MIILDEELANSLFGSAQEALNQIVEVNEINLTAHQWKTG